MSDIAAVELRSYVDRILRLKAEQDALKTDIRDIYAEAKSTGFDKTVLGKLVTYIQKRADKPAELQEQEAVFDLYLDAYDRAEPSHTHARAKRAAKPPPVVVDEPFDEETGELGSAAPEAELDRLEQFIETAGGVGPALNALLLDAASGSPSLAHLQRSPITNAPAGEPLPAHLRRTA